MIDPLRETLISLGAAGRHCPRDGRPPNPTTLWRWATKGLGPQKIKLEIIRVGGRTCTSREALRRFFAALNSPRSSDTLMSTATGPTRRQRKAARRAAAELERLGV